MDHLIKVVNEKMADRATFEEFREGLNANMRIYGHHVTVFSKKL